MRKLTMRACAVWLLMMAAEVVHGIARTLFLAPAVGEFRARQIGVFSGSAIVLLIATFTIRWLGAAARWQLVVIGLGWALATVLFEVALGRLFGFSWERLASDYDLLRGGLMPLGLSIMALAPLVAARLRRVSSAR